MRHLFRACDEVRVRLRRGRPLLRRDPRAEFRRPLQGRLRRGPGLARPQRARQLRDGRRHVARRRGLGACRADAHLPTIPGHLPRLRSGPRRRPCRSRRSRGRSSALETLEGTRLRNYYHWIALTYFITLVTNPAISLPCGVDQNGMPFGLQVIGRFRGDRDLLDAAEAMEQAFAGIAASAARSRTSPSSPQPNPELKSIVTHPPVLT